MGREARNGQYKLKCTQIQIEMHANKVKHQYPRQISVAQQENSGSTVNDKVDYHLPLHQRLRKLHNKSTYSVDPIHSLQSHLSTHSLKPCSKSSFSSSAQQLRNCKATEGLHAVPELNSCHSFDPANLKYRPNPPHQAVVDVHCMTTRRVESRGEVQYCSECSIIYPRKPCNRTP